MGSKKKKVRSSRGLHFFYHCRACKDIIVTESRCDDVIPFSILCFATPQCKGRMLQLNSGVKVSLPPTTYFYIWIVDNDGVLSLLEMPDRPRFKYLYVAMQRIFANRN